MRRSTLATAGHQGRRAVGFVARHVLPVGRARLAAIMSRHPGSAEVDYVDTAGYRRRSDLRDEAQARLFTGSAGVPNGVVERAGPGDWVIDVGASIGAVTGPLCRRVGPSGAVWAFEPVPANLCRLEELRQLNDLPQLRVLPFALSATAGRRELLLYSEGGSPFASFTASWNVAGQLEIDTRRLDDVVAELGPPGPLTFVKIDVEGHERQVLEGATQTLSRFRPLVYCEFNDVIQHDAGSCSAELLDRFRDLGYSVAPGWERAADALEGSVVDLLMAPSSS